MKRRGGFAGMPEDKRREIARAGGCAVHEQGAGRTWTAEEAKEASRRGVEARRRKRKEQGT